ncbi:hypothetical protein A9Q86_01900 [Flavobacteriales bacterium 33_180_T64]|nr:hypothetical protein A9Q86_01900 [Flavobacteriales bacterium 33_180_T64]
MVLIKSKFKNINLLLIAIVVSLLMSCGGDASKQPTDEKGFLAIEEELKNKFGDNAYYTDLTITYNKSIGNIIGVTVTEVPESLKMEQWNSTQGNWKQNQEISLEVPQGSKASDFMFQLNENINLSKLGELTEKSIAQLKAEKDLNNPILSMAFVKFPKNGELSKTEYAVRLEPEHGGTSFTFYYTLGGDLIKMDY